jgi:hypothetical protein
LIVMACGGVFPLPREVSRMAQSFGARMRERREKQQVSLIAIAEQTKIKLSLLDALERDDVTHWPSGIFRRAFIRAYAHAIGLNRIHGARFLSSTDLVETGHRCRRLKPPPPTRRSGQPRFA